MSYLFFIFFILAVLTCGSIGFGPFSLRVYATVLMLLYLLYSYRRGMKNKPSIDRSYVWLFLCFVGYLFIALVINGGLDQFNFFHKVLAFYLVCCVVFFAVDMQVNSYHQINILIFVLALIVLFDSIITLLQYLNHPIGWSIGTFFRGIEQFSDNAETYGVDFGRSILPGIFGHPVGNAFFLATCTPFFLSRFGQGSGIFQRVFYLFVIILSIVACFYIQQRAAFFLLIAVIIYHMVRALFFSRKRKLIFPFLALIILILGIYAIDFNHFEWGRLTDKDNSDRAVLWETASRVINESFLFGNPILYNSQEELSAHNIILDSFVTSGVLGAIIMSILYFKTLIVSFLSSFITKRYSLYTISFAYSVFICMIMGLFHNTSFYTGEALIFLSLALMLKSQELDKQTMC